MSKEYNGIKLPKAIIDELETNDIKHTGLKFKGSLKRKNGMTRTEIRKQERKEKKQRRIGTGLKKTGEKQEKSKGSGIEVKKNGSKIKKNVSFTDISESESEIDEDFDDDDDDDDDDDADTVMAKLAAMKAKKAGNSTKGAVKPTDSKKSKKIETSELKIKDKSKKSTDDLKSTEKLNGRTHRKTDDKKFKTQDLTTNDKSKKASQVKTPPISLHDAELMAQDEIEMEHYAKKLKMKNFKLNSQDDGLDDILGDLDFETFASDDESESSIEEMDIDDSNEESSISSDEQDIEIQKPKRENPYVAPIPKTNTSTQKSSASGAYVPPSKRAAQTTESDESIRLRRQLKGLLNRLSDSNIGSIVNSVSDLYMNNARNQMNNTLASIIIEDVNLQGTLLSSTFIVHAAFATALYRSIGVEFGAVFLQTLVETFEIEAAKPMDIEHKQAVNLFSLILEIYSFQMISCKLIYGFVRQFIEQFNESNAELLLQVIRRTGPQLRSDDPASLKEIIMLLKDKVAGNRANDLSSRTKFLLESITDLKNNKQKATNTMNLESVNKLKKFLGSFGKREPLQVTLDDLHNVETKGKWWIVGAAWNNSETIESSKKSKQVDSDDFDTTEINWSELARKERMNTDIRRAIFVAIMSSEDFSDAYERLQRLNLKNKQERDIPRVILHCCAGESTYNPFYSLLAAKLCTQRSFRKTFQFTLWEYLTNLEENQDIENEKSLQKTMNYARFFGFLVAKKVLTLNILKPVNFLTVNSITKLFCELLLVTVYSAIAKESEKTVSTGFGKSSEIQRNETNLIELFRQVKETTTLRGLQYFQETMKKSTMMNSTKEKERVVWASTASVGIIDMILSMKKEQDI